MTKISIVSRAVLVALAALVVTPAHAAWTLNMTSGVTDMAGELFNLHMLIFWICVVIGVGVFGMMLYSVIVHRKSRGFEASHFHESTVVEIVWTTIPFIILIAVAIPAAGTLLKVEDSSNPDMTIRVTGHQWLWEYDYVDADVHFFSRLDRASDKARQRNSGIDPSSVDHYLRNVDKPMVVPVDKKVRLLLTSGDVIHSWWVQELGGKKDAIPGYINDMWFKANEPGTYRGQCAELCGRGHAYMPIVVKVLPQDEYEDWIAQQGGKTQADSALATGQPSTDEANAQTQTQGENPTQGEANEGRTEDSEQLDTDEAKESVVGVGEKGDEKSAAEQQEDDAEQAASDRGSPKVDESGDQSSDESNDQSAEDDDGQESGDTEGASGNKDDGDQMSKSDLMSQGKQVYANICSACHQPDGSGMEAAGFPSLKGSAVATGDVSVHIGQILNGKGAMPPYKGTLDDKQIAAVVTYERNAFGNDTGDVIQPAQVAEQR